MDTPIHKQGKSLLHNERTFFGTPDISALPSYIRMRMGHDILLPDKSPQVHLGTIDPFPKRHKLVHNGGFPTFEALYSRINMVNWTEIS